MEESYEQGIADAEEMIFEDLHSGYGDQIYFDDPASEILDVLTYELSHGSTHYVDARDRCTEDDVTAFALYLAGRTPQMTGDLAAMVCDFIAKFGAEYRRWHADQVAARQSAKSA
ncbi:MAG: hypothetical protein IPM16_06650 [Chloroflexi bacterium]|nr:hypothetical protein [Chloroflexota bacterium]